MATKTIVCPECGSGVAFGRYACSECGALLAAVAVTPRSRASTIPADEAGRSTTNGPISARGDDPATGVAAVSAPDAPDIAPDAPDTPDIAPDAPTAEPVGVAAAFDEDAPLESLASATSAGPSVALPNPAATMVAGTRREVRSAAEPDVLHDLAGSTAVDEWSDDRPPGPSSEPAVDRGSGTGPARTPAGAYLPPSAILPPPDVRAPRRAATSPLTVVAAAARQPDPGAVAGTWASRGSAALTDALGSIRATADASHRAVAAGSGLATFGLLLPWVNTPSGANPFAGYLDRWGLAGPGLWLVFLGLVALTAVASSAGRAATWPVGLPAVATATFLMGLIWPYLAGGFGRAIGIWVVLVAVAVLAVGGLLDRRRRHDGPQPTV